MFNLNLEVDHEAIPNQSLSLVRNLLTSMYIYNYYKIISLNFFIIRF